MPVPRLQADLFYLSLRGKTSITWIRVHILSDSRCMVSLISMFDKYNVRKDGGIIWHFVSKLLRLGIKKEWNSFVLLLTFRNFDFVDWLCRSYSVRKRKQKHSFLFCFPQDLHYLCGLIKNVWQQRIILTFLKRGMCHFPLHTRRNICSTRRW